MNMILSQHQASGAFLTSSSPLPSLSNSAGHFNNSKRMICRSPVFVSHRPASAISPYSPSASLFPHNSSGSNKPMKPGPDESGLLAYSNTSYVAPLESPSGSSFIVRPLAEILRDLNKRVPEQVLKERGDSGEPRKYIPWYHANRMLSFYAPGWCGEVRDIKYSTDGKFVTVIYRVTIRGSDGEAFREASGTVSTESSKTGDPTQEAEALAFVRACARFGLGLYLHHEGIQ